MDGACTVHFYMRLKMLRIIFIYIRYCFFCFSNLFKLHKYLDFLSRKHSGSGLGKISMIIDRRVQNERRSGKPCRREDLILQFLCTAFRQDRERHVKEELELPLLLLFMWYCEPIDVSYSGEE